MSTYVLSDIHGQLHYFNDILRQISFSDDDTMYIIGDAIDRGKQPIELLLKIKSMKNITFLLGNHEYMMIQALKFKDNRAKELWFGNGGKTTYEQFQELSQKEQDELIDWLYNSPIAIPNITVNNKAYFLAHASHPLFFIEQPLYLKDVDEFDRYTILWSRDYQYVEPDKLANQYSKLYGKYPKTTLLFGHTPVFKTNYGVLNKDKLPMISRTGKGHLINLDCGSGSEFPLGCLRLEDQKEFYAKLPKGMKSI